MHNDFNHGIFADTAHRPWPMPRTPWIMTQTWHDLLFAHWPIDPDVMRARVPASLELDLHDGRAWIGVVAFRMSNVAPRGVPALPWLSAFPELNVRTYVRVGDRPGVYFFSLDASNSAAVHTARSLFHLPYFTAAMHVDLRSGAIMYGSRRTMRVPPAAELVVTYRPTGPVFNAEPGSLEQFLTERYCLYAIDRGGRPRRLEIHHPAWPLQLADADVELNTMAAAAGIVLPGAAPLLHFSKRQDMVAFPMRSAAVSTTERLSSF